MAAIQPDCSAFEPLNIL